MDENYELDEILAGQESGEPAEMQNREPKGAKEPAAEPEKENNAFDREAWIAQKKKEREDAFSLIDETAGRMAKDGALLKSYLDVQARFDRYSVSNAILVAAQMPEAKSLVPYAVWKERCVPIKKGEKAVTILEPGNEYQKRDGSTGVSYNTKKLFDISQTTSEITDKPVIHRDGRLLLKALIHEAPCRVQAAEDLPENVKALYDAESRTIRVRSGLSAQALFKAAAEEMAPAYMDAGSMRLQDGVYDRAARSFDAGCAAYIFCVRNNIPVDSFSFDSLPEAFTEKDARTVRKEFSVIRETANDISRDMDKLLQKECSRKKPEREVR